MWYRIKQWFSGFMSGRHGADQLSVALLWAGLAFYLLSTIIGSIVVSPIFAVLGLLFSTVGFVAYAFSVFRIFSRNLDKRDSENRRYLAMRQRMKLKRSQAKARFQNRKKYKYFKCPGCRTWLRLPRGAGVVTITCSRCHNSFTQKS